MLFLYYSSFVSVLAVDLASKIQYSRYRQFQATVSSTRARTLATSEVKIGEFCSLHPALGVPKLNVKALTFKTCKKVCFFVESRSKDVKDCLQ